MTSLLPKPLCPVGDVALVDLALDRARTVVGTDGAVAVNVHHGRQAMEAHLEDRGVVLSVEEPVALGTAGALGQLRGWISGRGVLVLNADAWCPGSLAGFAGAWDGERVRLLLAGEDRLGPRSPVAAALMPWSEVTPLDAVPSGLYERSWRLAGGQGRLEVVRHDGPFVDCGTPAQYLAANMAASGGASVVGSGALVHGSVERSVLWPGTVVHPGEHLVDAVRASDRFTVLVR